MRCASCPNGVAKVETQQSFLNLLANFLTSGLYSPMSITVTCAAKKTASATTIDAKARTTQEVAAAVEKALLQNGVAYLQF